MNLSLDQVTICAIDCVMPDLALRAIYKSLEACKFSEALFFSHQPIQCEKQVKFIRIDRLSSLIDYSRFLMKDLYRYVNTPYILIVQWDGYIIDQAAWTDEFLNFDYVGAKWPWHQDGNIVGNGGFSLRSKKLLDAVASEKILFSPSLPEDDQICRVHRKKLEEQFNLRFATEGVADQFSYERSIPNIRTFGFHGIFNIWRYLDDYEVKIFADAFPDSIYNSIGFYEFLLQYFALRKFEPLGFLYKKLNEHCTQDQIFSNLLKISNDERFAKAFLQLCDHNFLH